MTNHKRRCINFLELHAKPRWAASMSVTIHICRAGFGFYDGFYDGCSGFLAACCSSSAVSQGLSSISASSTPSKLFCESLFKRKEDRNSQHNHDGRNNVQTRPSLHSTYGSYISSIHPRIWDGVTSGIIGSHSHRYRRPSEKTGHLTGNAHACLSQRRRYSDGNR